MTAINQIKIFTLCLLLVSGFSGNAMGAGQGGPGQGPRGGGQPPALPDSTQIVEIVEQTAQALSLNGEQEVLISDLYFAHFAEARALMDSAQGQGGNNREQMDALRQDFEEEVVALLDDEQKEEFVKLVQKRGNRSGQRGQGRP